LDFLLHKPHIQHCVRTVRFPSIADEHERLELEYQKLGALLPLLTGVQKIEYCSSISHISNANAHRLDYFGEATLRLLHLIGSLQKRPAIALNDFSLEGLPEVSYIETVKALSSVSITSLKFKGTPQPISTQWSSPQEMTDVEDVQSILAVCPNLQSLRIMIQQRSAIHTRSRRLIVYGYESNSDDASSLPPLKELYLNGFMGLSVENAQHSLGLLSAFRWSSVERLRILDENLAEFLLPRFGDKMVNLRCLGISACPSPANRRWTASKHAIFAVSRFLASMSFEELELDGFGNGLAVKVMASVKLRKLRLHMWEMDPIVAQASLKSAKDIRELAELAPNMEHLMLDVAHVGKLWHPTAIPGVDVDVHLYQIFDALSKFPRLKKIHLFPRFYSANDNGRGTWQQAIEDDRQAVQMFKHVRAIQPSLEVLVLSSDNVVARFADIDPMSWTVCQAGDNTQLTVRQANKDYEQKQIWHGERRLRTEIQRDDYSKPYVDGAGPRLSRRRQR
jgi:hypothetical protein